MSIDEHLISLREAAKLPVFRINGKSPHLSGVYRWTMHGVRSRGGARIRLETIKTPSGSKTSIEAVHRFIAALSGETPLPPPTSAVRQKQITSAEKELVEAGFEVGGMAAA